MPALNTSYPPPSFFSPFFFFAPLLDSVTPTFVWTHIAQFNCYFFVLQMCVFVGEEAVNDQQPWSLFVSSADIGGFIEKSNEKMHYVHLCAYIAN